MIYALNLDVLNWSSNHIHFYDKYWPQLFFIYLGEAEKKVTFLVPVTLRKKNFFRISKMNKNMATKLYGGGGGGVLALSGRATKKKLYLRLP